MHTVGKMYTYLFSNYIHFHSIHVYNLLITYDLYSYKSFCQCKWIHRIHLATTIKSFDWKAVDLFIKVDLEGRNAIGCIKNCWHFKKKITTRAKKNYAIKNGENEQNSGNEEKKHSKNWIWKNPKLIYLHLSNSTLADMHVQIILNKILIVLNANWKQTTDCVVWHNQLNWISRGDIYHRDIYSTVQNSTEQYSAIYIVFYYCLAS